MWKKTEIQLASHLILSLSLGRESWSKFLNCQHCLYVVCFLSPLNHEIRGSLSLSLARVFHESPTEATRCILPFLLTTSMRSTWGVATLPSTLALARGMLCSRVHVTCSSPVKLQEDMILMYRDPAVVPIHWPQIRSASIAVSPSTALQERHSLQNQLQHCKISSRNKMGGCKPILIAGCRWAHQSPCNFLCFFNTFDVFPTSTFHFLSDLHNNVHLTVHRMSCHAWMGRWRGGWLLCTYTLSLGYVAQCYIVLTQSSLPTPWLCYPTPEVLWLWNAANNMGGHANAAKKRVNKEISGQRSTDNTKPRTRII